MHHVYYIFELLCQYDYLKLVKPKLNNENCLNEIFKSVQKTNSSRVFGFLMKKITHCKINNKKITKIEFSPKVCRYSLDFMNYQSFTSVTLHNIIIIKQSRDLSWKKWLLNYIKTLHLDY